MCMWYKCKEIKFHLKWAIILTCGYTSGLLQLYIQSGNSVDMTEAGIKCPLR